MIQDSICNKDTMFKYNVTESEDSLTFYMTMKKESQFFKLDITLELERVISENGETRDKVNSIEYQFNQYKSITTKQIDEILNFNKLILKENQEMKGEITELLEWKTKVQEKNKKEYDWLQTKWVIPEGAHISTVANPIPGFHAGMDSFKVEKQRMFLENYENLHGPGSHQRGGHDCYFKGASGIHPNLLHGDTFENQLFCKKDNCESLMSKLWFQHHMETLQI